MKGTPASVLFSLFCWCASLLLLAGWCLVFLLLSVFVAPRHLHWIVRRGCRSILAVCGVRMRVQGAEFLHIGPCIYMGNHVNMLDQFMVGALIPRPVIGLEAAEHFRWPVYGWIVGRWGNLPVSRSGNKDLNERSLGAALEHLKAGGALALMPEGHRSADGVLQRFRLGGFRLAVRAQVPIVPMVQRGALAINQKGSWLIRPGTIDILVCPPEFPEGDDEGAVERLMGKVRDVFEDVLGAEAGMQG